jgi:hypothetical protein
MSALDLGDGRTQAENSSQKPSAGLTTKDDFRSGAPCHYVDRIIEENLSKTDMDRDELNAIQAVRDAWPHRSHARFRSPPWLWHFGRAVVFSTFPPANGVVVVLENVFVWSSSNAAPSRDTEQRFRNFRTPSALADTSCVPLWLDPGRDRPVRWRLACAVRRAFFETNECP